jgi:hypothetical protein
MSPVLLPGATRAIPKASPETQNTINASPSSA